MEFSVRKRIGRILEDVQRTQKLAGMSDPEAGVVAPPNAYEDNYDGLKKRFGNDIINRLEIFVENHINEQLTLNSIEGEDINFKKSSSPTPENSIDANIKKATSVFIRFGGYMHDAKNYTFSLGYKDSLGQDIFAFRFTMDIEGKINNWQKSSF